VRKLAIGDEPVIDHRPADDIKPQLKTMRDRLDEAGYPGLSVEDVLSYALFPDVALNYFRSHR
jgi:oxaloacetate decarboxylase alpha subunit